MATLSVWNFNLVEKRNNHKQKNKGKETQKIIPKQACSPQTPKAVLTLRSLHIESPYYSYLCFAYPRVKMSILVKEYFVACCINVTCKLPAGNRSLLGDRTKNTLNFANRILSMFLNALTWKHRKLSNDSFASDESPRQTGLELFSIHKYMKTDPNLNITASYLLTSSAFLSVFTVFTFGSILTITRFTWHSLWSIFSWWSLPSVHS